MALSLDDLGLVSVSVSFMVVCINTLLNMGVFKTLFIIIGSILLFVLMRDGKLPPEIVYGVKHFGHVFTSNFMRWIALLRQRIFEDDNAPTNHTLMTDGDNDLTQLRSQVLFTSESNSHTSNHSNEEVTEDKEVECTVEELIGKGLVPNRGAAQITMQLISEGFAKSDAIKAANECSCLEFARTYLQKSCNLCDKVSSVCEVVPMMMCTHSFCKSCLKRHFETVTNSDYLDLSCPVCFLPDVESDEEIVHCHNAYLQTILETLLDENTSRKFQTMLAINAI